MSIIKVNGIEIEVQKKKVKNLHLHVKPDGKAYISMPKYVTLAEAERFAEANMDWILSQQKKFGEKPSKDYYVRRKPELDAKIKVLLPKWEAITGLKSTSWHTRYMTTRWGSCIPSKGRVCFNLQLVDKPEECLEYVILHELVHLKCAGHGVDFKNELSKFMPNWKEISNKLK